MNLRCEVPKMGDGPHPKRVPRLCGGGPQTNLDPRFELDSMGGIRIGSVIDQKGFGRPLEGFLLNYSQNYFVLPRNFAGLRAPTRIRGRE